MKQYLSLLQEILDEGTWQDNRTGVRTIGISGAHLKYDLTKGFPAVTTRKLAFKTFMGELVGFLRGYTSAEQFRSLGCKLWDLNANENAQWLNSPFRKAHDDCGVIYGASWRGWNAFRVAEFGSAQINASIESGYRVAGQHEQAGRRTVVLHKSIDQVRECLDKVMHIPTDRRILFHAWNPAELEMMALPPCHLLYQFNVNVTDKTISLCMYQRSCDTPLGLVGNLASSAALLSLFGRLTGYTPKWLNWFGGDVHIYESAIPMVEEQLKREPYAPPTLVLSDRVPAFAETGTYQPEWLDLIEPSDFMLEGYQHHPPLTAPMAV